MGTHSVRIDIFAHRIRRTAFIIESGFKFFFIQIVNSPSFVFPPAAQDKPSIFPRSFIEGAIGNGRVALNNGNIVILCGCNIQFGAQENLKPCPQSLVGILREFWRIKAYDPMQVIGDFGDCHGRSLLRFCTSTYKYTGIDAKSNRYKQKRPRPARICGVSGAAEGRCYSSSASAKSSVPRPVKRTQEPACGWPTR